MHLTRAISAKGWSGRLDIRLRRTTAIQGCACTDTVRIPPRVWTSDAPASARSVALRCPAGQVLSPKEKETEELIAKDDGDDDDDDDDDGSDFHEPMS